MDGSSRRKLLALTAGTTAVGSGCLGPVRLSGGDTAPGGNDACGGTPTGDFPQLSIEAEPVDGSANLDVEVEPLDGFDGDSTARFEVTLSNPSDRTRHYTFGSLAPLPPVFGSHETLESAKLALTRSGMASIRTRFRTSRTNAVGVCKTEADSSNPRYSLAWSSIRTKRSAERTSCTPRT